MHSAHEQRASRLDAEGGEPLFKLTRAFGVVSHAGYSARLLNVFGKHPRKLESEGFGFATAWSG
jgi:hypothetical protein